MRDYQQSLTYLEENGYKELCYDIQELWIYAESYRNTIEGMTILMVRQMRNAINNQEIVDSIMENIVDNFERRNDG